MSFLAPFFLAGALGIGLPVLLHLIRQTSKEKQVFSSLIFLGNSAPKLTKRRRVEHLLLLALRCLAILLLAFAFARPFFKQSITAAASAESPKRVMVLIDTSASMRRQGAWEHAQKEAAAALGDLEAGDEAALYSFDRQISPVVTFEQWSTAMPGERAALATQALHELRPTWFGSPGPASLMAAAEVLDDVRENGPARFRQLVVISDMQEGNRWEGLQGYEWPRGVAVDFRPVNSRRTGNASLQLLAEAGEARTSQEPSVRIRISNSSDSQRDLFRVTWADNQGPVGEAHELQVPPGQSRIMALPLPKAGSQPDRVVLSGDDEPYDNTIFVAPPLPIELGVMYFGRDAGDDPREPLYFLQRAFQDTRTLSVKVRSRKDVPALNSPDLPQTTLLIVTGSMSSPEVELVRHQVEAGKTALLTIQDDTISGILRGLLSAPDLKLEPATDQAFALMVDLDYKHPLLAGFADPRFSDFTRIRFWRHWKLDAGQIPGARVLARFDTGTPALIEAPLGKGRVIIWASSWRPQDSQMALSTKFVPLLYTILEQSGAPPAPPLQYFAGESISRILIGAEEQARLLGPDGESVAIDSSKSGVLPAPGLYSILRTNVVARFAVNLDPTESRTAPVSMDELERLGVPLRKGAELSPEKAAMTQLRLANAEIENRQKLWRWVIMVTLVVLLAETWLSGQASRTKVPASIDG